MKSLVKVNPIDKALSKLKYLNDKKVIDTSTSEIYESLTQAAKINNIKMATLSTYLTGIRVNKTTLIYLKIFTKI